MDDAPQAMMQVQRSGDLSYLQSRADAIQNIESTIVELGGIFQQLAHMIKEQEEIMVRIDSNVEDTQMNVEAGHQQILKYFHSVSSNRMLMVKIFGVLIFFFIFFVIFMAWWIKLTLLDIVIPDNWPNSLCDISDMIDVDEN